LDSANNVLINGTHMHMQRVIIGGVSYVSVIWEDVVWDRLMQPSYATPSGTTPDIPIDDIELNHRKAAQNEKLGA